MRLQKHLPAYTGLLESEVHTEIHFTSTVAHRSRTLVHLHPHSGVAA
ncbi:MAG: hypothetical protein ABSE46_21255 [Terracidiphilus sp.]|jgi:hypothetical protein